MANLGIIGYGIVGKAVEYGFNKENNIKFYDKYQDSDTLENVVKDSEFVFISLPTPFSEKEEKIDLTIIDENMKEITKLTNGTDKIVVMKSTVVPGTTRGYSKKYSETNFCFNPEFLTEANYLEDFKNADRHVVGADNDKTRLRVISLYRDSFPETPIYPTDLTSAEMVKYMANCFLATKVMFGNEMQGLCDKLGIKYEEVKKMVTADDRIYDSHLDVTSTKGFGGKCFPKDIVAMIGRGKELGADVSLLEKVWENNLKVREVRDWEEIPWAKSD